MRSLCADGSATVRGTVWVGFSFKIIDYQIDYGGRSSICGNHELVNTARCRSFEGVVACEEWALQVGHPGRSGIIW